MGETATCPTCHGTGHIELEVATCRRCGRLIVRSIDNDTPWAWAHPTNGVAVRGCRAATWTGGDTVRDDSIPRHWAAEPVGAPNG